MIADRYEPIEQIGAGGMATVWKARDTLLGRFVAIKRLLPQLASDPAAAARFQREAQAAAALTHPGIVTVFDTGQDEDGPYLVLELVEGITLADRLQAGGPLAPASVVAIVTQIASALDHAHSHGVVHRDVKPSNVILDDDGRARLADFGIARAVEDPATITDSGEVVGTITYLAPEVLAGEPATPASDIYSLAAVTFELLAGTPPYSGDSPAELVEVVRAGRPASLRGLAPDGMAAAVERAMSPGPGDRQASAGQFAAELVGSVTLVIGAGATEPVPAQRGGDEPTVVTRAAAAGRSAADPPRSAADPPRSSGARWLLAGGALGVLVLAAAALTQSGEVADGNTPTTAAPPATSISTTVSIPSTTPPSTTTTVPTTTTTVPTTTTLPATTTTASPTPESVSAEIAALLETLGPPEFRQREVRQVEERLERVMEEWAEQDREDLSRELERSFDEVDDLEPSEERDQLWDRFLLLSELMGFRVERDDGGDEDG